MTTESPFDEWNVANSTYEDVLRELSALRKTAVESNDTGLLLSREAKEVRERATQAYLIQHKLHKVYLSSLDTKFKPMEEPGGDDVVSPPPVKEDDDSEPLRVEDDTSSLRVEGDDDAASLRVEGDDDVLPPHVEDDDDASSLRVEGDDDASSLRVEDDDDASPPKPAIIEKMVDSTYGLDTVGGIADDGEESKQAETEATVPPDQDEEEEEDEDVKSRIEADMLRMHMLHAVE